MNCWRVLKSVQASVAHCFLFSFTLALVLKLDHSITYSWWVVCLPLWAFHAVVARGRFSLPAPIAPRNRHWAPCHAIVSTPLLIAFELLLCVYLETAYADSPPAVSLKIVFLPLLAFEVIILVDNARMCRALMPGDEESVNDEAVWEALPHFWVAISMVFFLAATVFTLLKLSGDVAALGWWDLFINFGIAECFAFLVCTKCGLGVFSEDDRNQDTCGLQDIGGHIMKIPLIVFQVVLCMHLEGTPEAAKSISVPVLFSPLFLLQGVGVLFAASKLIEKVVLLLRGEDDTGLYFRFLSRAHDCLGFLHHGSRLLGWWSIDEGSREEEARLYFDQESGYNTFCGHPPEIVKKMPKKELAEEVWRLQAALGEQTEITKFSQQEYERLQNEKVLCRVCFEREISVVLLPCRHRVLCRNCSDKCKKCPFCRITIEERLPVYDV
ncbi:Transmembrane Fragile-X-F-associated protein [Arabidopsis thaliana]|uniref:Transmembrane Fragile-X-F-associated protein n=1 Tax=Arabidopsis thaliana TaxID=3702 RepID=A0A1P8AV52_ARATH|nr:Transmembrane Fragile-X-F-associated protein [Arabidopsis thaliana]ANM60523.1 Transmembrane Fragile-X-F-associated protein [Arabidopsis thaliana]|eukprot:NP_001322804.1 Transmembrane Fragile-X-F-associated protein [Arabidopsis thaliana]